MGQTSLALAAILLELVFGYPDWLYRRIGHPVGWIAVLLDTLERHLNRAEWNALRRRFAGIVALLLVLLVTAAVTVLLDWVLPTTFWGFWLRGLVVAVLLAPRTLRDHVRSVAEALGQGGVIAGRMEVARIVGRDPEQLDASGVCRAAIESLAENFSDGVIAPLFWCLAAGLPGIALYKAINTADSLIGHRNIRFAAFGWAAARLDDLVNLPASRLTAALIALAAPGTAYHAACTAWRDAHLHRSPNAGWPEAAMAGALGLSLVGPRLYAGHVADDPWLGDGRRAAGIADLRAALRLYDRALVMVIILLVAATILSR